MSRAAWNTTFSTWFPDEEIFRKRIVSTYFWVNRLTRKQVEKLVFYVVRLDKKQIALLISMVSAIETMEVLYFFVQWKQDAGLNQICYYDIIKEELTILFQMQPFSIPWKYQKTFSLMFSGGRKRMYWEQMGLISSVNLVKLLLMDSTVTAQNPQCII